MHWPNWRSCNVVVQIVEGVHCVARMQIYYALFMISTPLHKRDASSPNSRITSPPCRHSLPSPSSHPRWRVR